MKQIALLLSALTWLAVINSLGQQPTSCPNSDFSQGTFANWQGFYGDFWNPAQYDGFDQEGHKIMTDPVPMDKNTCDGLNPIPPGSKYSARLGDDKHDSHADQLRYLINVNDENNLFIYKYAVVLEDPGHDPGEQPNFTIEVADSAGNLIDSTCGYYFVYAHQGMPTWHTCGEVIWKDWTTVGIDLSGYTGQTVSIKFTSRDCAIGGHFGYAYLSAYCGQVRITYGSCPGDTVATLTAPSGFSYLWSDGQTTQSIFIHQPVVGRVDSCVLTSVNGCKVTVKGIFHPTLISASFGYTPEDCEGASFSFSDSTTINQNDISQWEWSFGDGTPKVNDEQDIQHVYDSSGVFTAWLKVVSSDGCPDSVSHPVTVVAIPKVTFSADPPCGTITLHDTIFFDQQTRLDAGPGYDHYSWNTGDTSSSVIVTTEGLFSVKVDNAGICYATDSVMLLQCAIPLWMPNAFTPGNDGLNDIFRPATQPEDVTAFHMIITDRWGTTIFESSQMNAGWDGTIDGKTAPVGVYAYIIAYRVYNAETRQMKGTVSLVR